MRVLFWLAALILAFQAWLETSNGSTVLAIGFMVASVFVAVMSVDDRYG